MRWARAALAARASSQFGGVERKCDFDSLFLRGTRCGGGSCIFLGRKVFQPRITRGETNTTPKTNGEFNWPDSFHELEVLPGVAQNNRRRPDWLHNACGRFYFQIAYCLFPVPRVPRRPMFVPFSLRGLSMISALLDIDNTWSNFVVDVDTSLRPLRCSKTTLIDLPSNRYFSSELLAMPVDDRGVDGLKAIRREDDMKNSMEAEFVSKWDDPPIIGIISDYDQSENEAVNGGWNCNKKDSIDRILINRPDINLSLLGD